MIIDEVVMVVGLIDKAGDVVTLQLRPRIGAENIKLSAESLLVTRLQGAVRRCARVDAVFGDRGELGIGYLQIVLGDGG